MKLLKYDSVSIQYIFHVFFYTIATALVDSMQPLNIAQHNF